MTLIDREYQKFEEIAEGKTAVNVQLINQLIPEVYDKIELGYTGEDLTSVVYKLNGSTVSTLTLGYTGDKLTSVEKS